MKNQKTQLGRVEELLPNARFKIHLEGDPEGKYVQCYTSGKMRIHKINVMVGDIVEVVMDDIGHIGRVVRRK